MATRIVALFVAALVAGLAHAQQASPTGSITDTQAAKIETSSPDPSQRRTIAAVPLTAGEAITLDGRLDENVWGRAAPGTDFIQQDPDNGRPATEQTEVR